jgi:hypothetical protein
MGFKLFVTKLVSDTKAALGIAAPETASTPAVVPDQPKRTTKRGRRQSARKPDPIVLKSEQKIASALAPRQSSGITWNDQVTAIGRKQHALVMANATVDSKQLLADVSTCLADRADGTPGLYADKGIVMHVRDGLRYKGSRTISVAQAARVSAWAAMIRAAREFGFEPDGQPIEDVPF